MAFVSLAQKNTIRLLPSDRRAFGYIERYLDGLSQDDFALDSKTQDAVAMRLQQILECAAKLSSVSKIDLK